jgi:cell volume regulation protein A
MTTTIIITICTLLLIAYIFDLTASRTKIPSVILLLLLGWIVRQLTTTLHITVPDLSSVLPVLGTIGLILIVLEGSFELELNRSKTTVIIKSAIVALLPMIALAFLLTYVFRSYQPGISFRDALTNAIPICVISSSIAISGAKHLSARHKEFITYESSLSDIFGVIFFNAVALNEFSHSHSIGESVLQLLIMILVSFVATIVLAFLLGKIDHHIKFIPIILLILLIYSIAKLYHLPALIFILILGLFLGNLDELKRFKWINKLKPYSLNKEILKFKELTVEATFLIRTLFFLLFGYLIETSEILNAETFLWAIGIVTAIMVIRALQFKLFRINMRPMLFMAPRGLINILLFLSIIPSQNIPMVNKSLLLQVILLTTFIMMIGLMVSNKKTHLVKGENKIIDAHESAIAE